MFERRVLTMRKMIRNVIEDNQRTLRIRRDAKLATLNFAVTIIFLPFYVNYFRSNSELQLLAEKVIGTVNVLALIVTLYNFMYADTLDPMNRIVMNITSSKRHGMKAGDYQLLVLQKIKDASFETKAEKIYQKFLVEFEALQVDVRRFEESHKALCDPCILQLPDKPMRFEGNVDVYEYIWLKKWIEAMVVNGEEIRSVLNPMNRSEVIDVPLISAPDRVSEVRNLLNTMKQTLKAKITRMQEFNDEPEAEGSHAHVL